MIKPVMGTATSWTDGYMDFPVDFLLENPYGFNTHEEDVQKKQEFNPGARKGVSRKWTGWSREVCSRMTQKGVWAPVFKPL